MIISKKLKKLEAACIFRNRERNAIIEQVLKEMELGLCGKKSSLKMLPAFVWPPTGDEQGTYLAIDFGGTNLRILSVTLKGKGKIAEPKMCSHVIGQKIISGTKAGLGNFIVDKVLDFMQSQKMDIAMQTEIGFTFSFPIRQESIVS
ncbi:MAG: hexokinase family protein, partial [Candidatus Moranbacteria bacterium]|nr:hexokinase family protein [Candidatus Moranbacteria bacterium]